MNIPVVQRLALIDISFQLSYIMHPSFAFQLIANSPLHFVLFEYLMAWYDFANICYLDCTSLGIIISS